MSLKAKNNITYEENREEKYCIRLFLFIITESGENKSVLISEEITIPE